jgi:hypothetical protein
VLPKLVLISFGSRLFLVGILQGSKSGSLHTGWLPGRLHLSRNL